MSSYMSATDTLLNPNARAAPDVYQPSTRLPPAHGILYSKKFAQLSMDDLQVCLGSGELTAAERKQCMEVYGKRLYG